MIHDWKWSQPRLQQHRCKCQHSRWSIVIARAFMATARAFKKLTGPLARSGRTRGRPAPEHKERIFKPRTSILMAFSSCCLRRGEKASVVREPRPSDGELALSFDQAIPAPTPPSRADFPL